MSRCTRYGPLFSLAALLAGCYTTNIDITPPQKAHVDTTLLGHYDIVDEKQQHTSLRISPFDEHQYYVESTPDNQSSDRYRAITTQVAGATFAELKDLGGGFNGDQWIVVRIDCSDDGLIIRHLNGNFFDTDPVSSPAELRQVIADNVGNRAMYVDEPPMIAKRG